MLRLCACLALLFFTAFPVVAQEKSSLTLNLRTRAQPFKNAEEWLPVTVTHKIPAQQVGMVICDMWDKHWCPTANERCGIIAKKMAKVVEAARAQGVTIIHAPSDCMAFYKDYPQRQRLQQIKQVPPPVELKLANPPLPIDDKDGGCDCPESVKSYRAWTRQHEAIRIDDRDYISDNGKEVYSCLKQRGIKLLLVMGVHTNMCILHRTFAIKQMTKWGVPVVLVRDLTDSMYSPKRAPFVSHDRGTELVVEYIERHWCPSISSADLVQTAR